MEYRQKFGQEKTPKLCPGRAGTNQLCDKRGESRVVMWGQDPDRKGRGGPVRVTAEERRGECEEDARGDTKKRNDDGAIYRPQMSQQSPPKWHRGLSMTR